MQLVEGGLLSPDIQPSPSIFRCFSPFQSYYKYYTPHTRLCQGFLLKIRPVKQKSSDERFWQRVLQHQFLFSMRLIIYRPVLSIKRSASGISASGTEYRSWMLHVWIIRHIICHAGLSKCCSNLSWRKREVCEGLSGRQHREHGGPWVGLCPAHLSFFSCFSALQKLELKGAWAWLHLMPTSSANALSYLQYSMYL